MTTIHRCVRLIAVSVFALNMLAAQDSTFRGDKVRFQSAIAKFLSEDSVQPPPQRAILFIGSSIFRRWESLRADMAPLPVFNRAFGGSRTHEVLYYIDRIVVPYQPKIIVYYCGSNDAGGSVPAVKAAANITEFFERVKDRLPETKIFFVSVNRSPARTARWPGIDSINTLIQEYCRRTENRYFIDVNAALFDDQGKPRLDLYLEDRLHFKSASYIEFTKIIKPVLEREWQMINSGKK